MLAADHAPPKDASRISGMFDAIAGRYDLLNHLLSAGLDQSWRRQAIDALELTGQETVLDLCTGTGDLALAAISEQRRARRVVGVDFSRAMLQIAKTKIADAPAIALLRGDATGIPLAASTVDAVTIGFGIRNVEDPVAAFHEIGRVLRPGGRLAILEFSLPRAKTLRSFYLWYFRRVLPMIGRLVSKHPSAYTYLPESVEAFPTPEAFAEQLRGAGFGTVRARALTFGVVYLFVAAKNA
jgi:demethylmenaquinone methyltransferase/2-methoxy-6-polyprenyl-1,4-benzoquinol methylase